MTDTLRDYFDALERLKRDKPKVVPKGSRINKDTVALEAGRGKGSIKKSRVVFADLIRAIEMASAERVRPRVVATERIERLKGAAHKYRLLYEEAIAREVSLLYQVYELRKELGRLTGANIRPIRANVATDGTSHVDTTTFENGGERRAPGVGRVPTKGDKA